MVIPIWVKEEVVLDEADLPSLAEAVREWFEQPPDAPVYLEALLSEAARRELLAWPAPGDWRIDDEWEEPLTEEELRELVAGPEEDPPSCPHCGAGVAPDDRVCPDCDGTVYRNFGPEEER